MPETAVLDPRTEPKAGPPAPVAQPVSGPKFDVMVIAHNHLHRTAACIETLYRYTRIPFHLIVVDDSTDLTPIWMGDFIRRMEGKAEVTHLYSSTPYRNGNQIFNRALQECRTPYMATVMNSIKVEPEWEIGALQLLESNQQVGVVALKCLFPNGLIESSGIRMRGWIPCDIARDNISHRCGLIYDVEAAQMALAFLRVEAAKGKFNEASPPEGFYGFRGWDDIDNCFQMRKAGWKILMCGSGVGYHEPRATRGNDSPQAEVENRANGHLFFKRNGFWDMFIKAHPDGLDVHTVPTDQMLKNLQGQQVKA